MCGIAGYINLDNKPASKNILKKMTDAIRHRGPDGEGSWIKNNIAIGHRRLSIIDLSPSGNQPMISSDKRYILSYNGEIYNFKEIKKQLELKGYKFFSLTDSEVVLNSIIEWGEEAIKKFNGMFAFVFWDNLKKELILARDRYGIKPLYYSLSKDVFSFASEQKSIIFQNFFNRNLEFQAIMEYFTFQNIFSNKTFLKDIYLLEPGHFGIFRLNKKKLILKKYWDFKFEEAQSKKNNDYVKELEFLFNQAVNRQLISDVEIGSYLSGGMDSGSIAAIVSKSYKNLKTFTCGFDLTSASGLELALDERDQAEFISSYFKTEQYEMVLKSGDMERCLPNLVWHLEEPRVGQCYPNYYIANLASKFVKVVLSGIGGDEIFGGYPWRYFRSNKNNNFDEFIDQYYLYWQRLIDNKNIHRLFEPVKEHVRDVWTRDIFRDVFLKHGGNLKSPEDYINHSLYFETKTFLHGLLVVEDKMSMAFGLETRVPFLDNDLVDFALKCPVSLKLKNLSKIPRINENDIGGKKNKFFKSHNDGKQILRTMLSKYIPNRITEARKKGFSSPDASWFKGESIEFVKEILHNKNSNIYELLDYKEVNLLFNEHIEGTENRRLFIWSLINFEEWLKQFKPVSG